MSIRAALEVTKSGSSWLKSEPFRLSIAALVGIRIVSEALRPGRFTMSSISTRSTGPHRHGAWSPRVWRVLRLGPAVGGDVHVDADDARQGVVPRVALQLVLGLPVVAPERARLAAGPRKVLRLGRVEHVVVDEQGVLQVGVPRRLEG